MATPTPSTVVEPLTGDPVIDAATTGYRWTLNADRTIDWSISNGFAGEFWNSPATVQQYVAAALDLFSYYADVRFNYVGSFATPALASAGGSELNVSLSGEARFFPSNLIWAIGVFPSSTFAAGLGLYASAPGDVFLNINSQANFLTSYDPGSAGWALLIHELGHALGLKHPHDDGGTGRPTLSQIGAGDADFDWATMMAYSDTYDWNLLSFEPATPMVLDVLALQYLYGPNMSTNAGDGVYELTASGRYQTLWDAAGIDEVSVANSDRGWEIVLPDYQLSSLVPTKVGWAVPRLEANLESPMTLHWLMGDMEDATGSQFSDDIYGSNLGNFILGRAGVDWIEGGGGNDSIDGGADADWIYGDAGDDVVQGGSGNNYLRGGDGNDWIVGGDGVDDSHGNAGNDTVHGGAGADWVVGGKDDDLLFGDDGDDLSLGNLGADTIDGGAGNDVVRGGQQNDVVRGNAGDDWVSGDRGDDTLTGGTGADRFHVFDGSGADRVTDFSVAEGDRLWILAGTQYSVAQVGADTVVTVMGVEGGTLTLVGVQMSSLPTGWVFTQ